MAERNIATRRAWAVVSVVASFPSFVFGTGTGKAGSQVELRKDLPDGTTVIRLLSDLVTGYPGFREAVFNPESGTVNEQIGVILNDTLLTFAEITETTLKEGDSLTILPIYAGG
jgi:molybdopterin converting factor small subunit